MDLPANAAAAATTVPTSRLRRWWPLIKWSVFAVMLYFVGCRGYRLWESSPEIKLHIDVPWLIPAALLYLIGWLPSVWFWRELLHRMDQHPGLYESIRAYFVGHLGKYVPGKALVLVIRGAMLKEGGTSPVLGGLTAAYETLVSMAAGASIAVALAPLVIPTGLWERLPAGMQFLRQQSLLVPLVVAFVTIASTPISAMLFTRIGRKAVPPVENASPARTGISARLVLHGVLITSAGWVCHALSLGCTLQSVSESAVEWNQFPVWLATVSLSTFSGFVVMVAPGGLGVREWVLVEILKDQSTIGVEKAIVVAGLLRLVWFVAELAVAGPLYIIKPRRHGITTDA
ncbi:MAG: flippase-like domain-containing protein [Planctomycetes bacterium]|nr:flippase-like domain-containing protein [Planctomycetota bacterium]